MRHPYRDSRVEAPRSSVDYNREIAIAMTFVRFVALLRFALAVLHHEPLLGDPAVAALFVVSLAPLRAFGAHLRT